MKPELIIKKIDILVADDMESIRKMVQSCLIELGAESVFMAEDGNAAWRKINNQKIDLIICDWDMPVLNGFQLLQKVRASQKFSQIPFLMLTANIERSDVMSAIAAGVDEYLTKPFQVRELEYRIIKILRKVDVR